MNPAPRLPPQPDPWLTQDQQPDCLPPATMSQTSLNQDPYTGRDPFPILPWSQWTECPPVVSQQVEPPHQTTLPKVQPHGRPTLASSRSPRLLWPEMPAADPAHTPTKEDWPDALSSRHPPPNSTMETGATTESHQDLIPALVTRFPLHWTNLPGSSHHLAHPLCVLNLLGPMKIPSTTGPGFCHLLT